jgi:hypothetical protein
MKNIGPPEPRGIQRYLVLLKRLPGIKVLATCYLKRKNEIPELRTQQTCLIWTLKGHIEGVSPEELGFRT